MRFKHWPLTDRNIETEWILGDTEHIRASWPASFKNEDDVDRYNKKYPEILPPASTYRNMGRYASVSLAGNYPKACSREIQRYFESAFDKAAIFIMLSGQQGEYIRFKLKAITPKARNGDLPAVATCRAALKSRILSWRGTLCT